MVFFFFSSRRRHTRYWRDWSSDVCSSDLLSENFEYHAAKNEQRLLVLRGVVLEVLGEIAVPAGYPDRVDDLVPARAFELGQIGRASCRERVQNSVGAVPVKKEVMVHATDR